MSSPIEKFSSILEELSTLRAPGVSGSRIKKLTDLALSNVQFESLLVQKLYTHFKGTPPTHKLGALYVTDSIVRAYLDEARKTGQSVTSSAPEGTYAAAVYKVENMIENLMNDIMNVTTTEDQKDKISKLVDIWEKSQTFNPTILANIRQKHFKPADSPPSKSAQDPSSLLQALSALKNAHPPPVSTPAPVPSVNQQEALLQLLQQNNVLPQPQMQHSFNGDNNYGRSRGNERVPRRDRSRSPRRRRSHDNSRRNDVRSRSPTHESNHERNLPGTIHYRPTIVSYDETIPAGEIKVLSRTLFIGGVPPHMDQDELLGILRPYAEVQSITINNERRHAFVKVYSRAEAESAKNKFEEFNENGGLSLRARWGVGFGPRDCCDYSTGSSTVPLSRLTDADKKWITCAEWGGTGGKPLAPGICIEEPDIEIGAGVSSKAISKRMPTNSSKNGPKSTNNDRRGDRGDRGERTNSNRIPLGGHSQQQMPFGNGGNAQANNLAMLMNGFPQIPQSQPVSQQNPQQLQVLQQLQQNLQNVPGMQNMLQALASNPQMAASFFQQQQQQPPH